MYFNGTGIWGGETMLSDLLKTKLCGNYPVVEPKKYYFGKTHGI